MKSIKLKMLLFALALIPMVMQAQPAANDAVVAGKGVALGDLSWLVFAVASTMVYLIARKKKQVA